MSSQDDGNSHKSEEEAMAIFAHLPPAVRAKLEAALNQATSDTKDRLEIGVLIAVRELLEEIAAAEGQGAELELSDEQIEAITIELEKIAEKLENDDDIGESDAIKFLLHAIRRRLKKKAKDLDIDEQEFEFDFMSKKEKEQYREHLKQMMRYEVYKFLSPRQVAGESKLENFINNVVHFGMDLAAKYVTGAGADVRGFTELFETVMGNAFVKDLSNLHSSFTADPTAFANRDNSIHPDSTPTVKSVTQAKGNDIER